VKREAQHGTVSRYTGRGCRCDPCRRAMSEYSRAHNRKHPARVATNNRIYYAALRALRDSYPEEFDKLLAYYREHPEETGGAA
jgi:hypothetical protein